jgi:hypothetical protein
VAPAGGCFVTLTLPGASGGNMNTKLGGNGANFDATFWSNGVTPFVVGYGAGGGVELPFGGTKRSGHGREKGLLEELFLIKSAEECEFIFEF